MLIPAEHLNLTQCWSKTSSCDQLCQQPSCDAAREQETHGELCTGSPSHLVPCTPTASLPGSLRFLCPPQALVLQPFTGTLQHQTLAIDCCPASCLGCKLLSSVDFCNLMLQWNDIEMEWGQQHCPHQTQDPQGDLTLHLSQAHCLLAHGSDRWRWRLSLLPSLVPLVMSSSSRPHGTSSLLLQLWCCAGVSMPTAQHKLVPARLLGLHVAIACREPRIGSFPCLRWRGGPMPSLVMQPIQGFLRRRVALALYRARRMPPASSSQRRNGRLLLPPLQLWGMCSRACSLPPTLSSIWGRGPTLPLPAMLLHMGQVLPS